MLLVFCYRASFMENGSAMIEIAWPRAGKWHFFYADEGNLCFSDLCSISTETKMTVNLSVTLQLMNLLIDCRFRITVVSTSSNISI